MKASQLLSRLGIPAMSPHTLHALREFSYDLAALVWPTQCVVCGADDRDCCAMCRARVRSEAGHLIEEFDASSHRICASGGYEEPVKALILGLKHQGFTGFAKLLAPRLLAPLSAVIADASGTVLLVGAPSRVAKVRERGYRHVELIIRAALRLVERAPPDPTLVLLPRALRASAGRATQLGLSSESRRSNAVKMSVKRRTRTRLAGAQVVLVDDVVTTGATVMAASDALTAAGARVLGVVALCRVQRRDQSYRKMP